MASEKLTRRNVLTLLGGAGVAVTAGPDLSGRAGAASFAGVPAITGSGTQRRPQASDVTLRMWSNHPEWRDTLVENLAVYEEQSGVTLEVEPRPGPEYVQALTIAMQANEGPDLPGIIPGPLVREFLESGYIEDLTGQIGVDRLTPLAQERVTIDGTVVGSPFGKYTVGMYYHTDKFEEHGLEVPSTWDEFRSVCQALSDAGETPLMMPARDGVIPSFHYMLFTGSVMGEAGFDQLLAGERQLTDDDLVAAIDLLIELEPYYPEGFAAIAYADGKATFARGDTAMILGGTADYAGFVEVNPDLQADFFAFPPPDADTGGPAVVSGLELIYTVNSDSEHREEATAFIDWLTTPESNELFANSITLPTVEGVTPGNNPIWATQLALTQSAEEIPTWRDVEATNPVWNVLTENMQLVLLGEMQPEELAEQAQAALVVSG